MKLILEINVKITGYSCVNGEDHDIVMIPFTATCDCEYFRGSSVFAGCDTQTLMHGGKTSLSARYMLEGVDADGNGCRIFIENNGDDMMMCTPKITTDSKALSFLEKSPLKSEVTPADGGVTVRIFTL